jgi:hypothetical protein
MLAGAMFLGSPVGAEDDPTVGKVSRLLEMPSHQWLARVRDAAGAEIAPFTTDGCSGGMSSVWVFIAERYPAFAEVHEGVPPWEDCCIRHDRVYHSGGADPDPEASYSARVTADEQLRQCVVAKADERNDVLRQVYGLDESEVHGIYEAIGTSMFHAVRLGGQPCTGLPWRWGYGYPHCWDVPAD